MESYQVLREQARKRIQVADHMLTMTYPLVKDARLLLTIMENIFLALTHSMGAVLHYERLYKRVPPFTDNFENKLSLFKERCMHKYNVDKKYTDTMRNIKDIIIEHKKSPIEFARQDRFIICSDNYRIKAVSLNDIKGFLENAKEFVRQASSIISKNEAIESNSAKLK